MTELSKFTDYIPLKYSSKTGGNLWLTLISPAPPGGHSPSRATVSLKLTGSNPPCSRAKGSSGSLTQIGEQISAFVSNPAHLMPISASPGETPWCAALFVCNYRTFFTSVHLPVVHTFGLQLDDVTRACLLVPRQTL